MSDPPEKKVPEIPEWQQAGDQVQVEPEGEKEHSSEHQLTPAETPSSRTLLIEQAEAFLEEKDVRDASTSKKISFLQSKGLTDAEIDGLLEKPPDSQQEAGPESPVYSTLQAIKSIVC